MDISRMRFQLQEYSSETERIFTSLGESFPAMLTLKSGKDSPLAELTSFIESLRGNLENADRSGSEEFLSTFHTRNRTLFDDLSAKMEALGAINERIAEIRSDSEELEIISLNAMVISIKSGEKGKAFSVITENLKKLSSRMISLSNELLLEERKLIDKTDSLKNNVSSIVRTEGSKGASAEHAYASRLKVVLDDSYTRLGSLEAQASTALDPIKTAMGGIQLQDIIKQSLDQINLVISEIAEVSPSAAVEERLDTLTLNLELLEVSRRILSDCVQHLEHSHRIFSQNWERLHAILDSVESERTAFISRFLDPSSPSSMSTIIGTMNEAFTESIRTIGAYQRNQSNLVADTALIVSAVKHLRALFDTIKPIISRLQHVRITQQIEVAKNPAIATVKDTVDHMSVLIMNADLRVQDTRTELEQFIKEIEALTSGFADEAERYQHELERIKNDKLAFFGAMKDSQGNLSSAIRSLRVYPDSFNTLCNTVDGLLSSLFSSITAFQERLSSLDSLISGIAEERSGLLSKIGEQSWSIHNEKLRRLAERFTITTHKEAAGKIGHFEVEKESVDSVDSGEVTLFF